MTPGDGSPEAGASGAAGLLDELDAVLDEAWTAIGAEDLDAVGRALDRLPAPPAAATIPASLRVRAEQVLERFDRLDEALTDAQRAIGRDLAAAPRLGAADRAVPCFIDRAF